jgi:hypothetical protein
LQSPPADHTLRTFVQSVLIATNVPFVFFEKISWMAILARFLLGKLAQAAARKRAQIHEPETQNGAIVERWTRFSQCAVGMNIALFKGALTETRGIRSGDSAIMGNEVTKMKEKLIYPWRKWRQISSAPLLKPGASFK